MNATQAEQLAAFLRALDAAWSETGVCLSHYEGVQVAGDGFTAKIDSTTVDGTCVHRVTEVPG